MRCPKCHSENCYAVHDETKQGFSVGKGCCGFILMGGPLGLLCGLCGKDNVKSEKDYWICNNCGTRFESYEALNAQREYELLQEVEKAVTSAEKDIESNPSNFKLIEKKSKCMKRIQDELSGDDASKFIFFDEKPNEQNTEYIKALFRRYLEFGLDLDLKTECVYFIYRDNTKFDLLMDKMFKSVEGTMFTSKGVYHFSHGKYILTPAEDIGKIYIDDVIDSNIHLGNKNTSISFNLSTPKKSTGVLYEILRELYVEESCLLFSETNDSAYGCGNHISRGNVLELSNRILYNNQDRKALVCKTKNEEFKVLNYCPKFLAHEKEKIYITNEIHNICELDLETRTEIVIYQANCIDVHLKNGVFAFSNFSDKERLYTVNADGTNPRKLVDDKVSNITIVGEWIYYINKSDKNSAYKVKIDGTDITKIYGEDNCDKLIVDGEYIYYISKKFNTLNGLFRVSLDGKKVEAVAESIESYTVAEEAIFLATKDCIIEVPKNDISSYYELVNDVEVDDLCIVNNNLYFRYPRKFFSVPLEGYVTHRFDYKKKDEEDIEEL